MPNIKIYDASNSSSRPAPRGLGGPVENDIVRYLKKYAHRFSCTFVSDSALADVVFTNDVFPQKYAQPKVKRMDGVYSRQDLMIRNDKLNTAAATADVVIFISDFSKNSLLKLYPEITVKHSLVALNAADPSEFYSIVCDKKYDFVTTANDWSRPEKRGQDIELLAQAFPELSFAVIGNSSACLPNVAGLGYKSSVAELNLALNQAKSFIYLGFNDPAPKTVCQAIACEMPLFLTNSGGNFELAQENACYTEDITRFPVVHEVVPALDAAKVLKDFSHFLNNPQPTRTPTKCMEQFNEMLSCYFNAFRSVCI